MEIILLINGILFAYLVFSKNLSDKKTERNERAVYLGLGVLFFFIVVVSLLHLLGMHQVIEIILWVVTLITSTAIGIRLFQVFTKKA